MRFDWLIVAAAAGAAAAPAVQVVYPEVVKPVNSHGVYETGDLTYLARSAPLEKRISEDFSLDKQFNDDLLFHGVLTNTDTPVTASTDLTVTCVECYTKGTVTARLTTKDIFKPVIRFDLKGVEAMAKLDVKSTGSLVFAINLFTSETPLGLSIPGLKIGIIFSVDLVFVLSDSMDIQGGFYTKLADDAFFQIEIFDGDITDHLFDGTGFKTLPVTVSSGPLTFQADLRMRVDAGASAGFKIGPKAGASVGVFANVVEFVATVNSTETCALEAQEFIDMNVGAQASAGINAGPKTLNVVPKVVTTLIKSPVATQCLLEKKPAAASSVEAIPSAPASETSAAATESAAPVTESSAAAPESSAPVTESSAAVTESSAPVTSTAAPITSSPTLPSESSTGVVSTSAAAPPTKTGGCGVAPDTTPLPVPVKRRQDARSVFVITTCAQAVVNCPVELAKIITVTADPAAATAAPKLAAQDFNAKAQNFGNLMVLSEMASPPVSTFVASPTA